MPFSAIAEDVRYRIVRLPALPGAPPGDYGDVLDFNDAGQISGYSWTFENQHAARWDPDCAPLDLGSLIGPGGGSLGEAINQHGVVAGPSHATPQFNTGACVWAADGTMTSLGDLPGGDYYSWAKGINNLNQVVGVSVSARYGEWMEEAFYWDAQHGMIGLGNLAGYGHGTSLAYAINDDGWVTGWSESPRGFRAFLWTLEAGLLDLTDVSGSPFTISDPYAINQYGQITGQAYNRQAPGTVMAFVWTPGQTPLSLGSLPGFEDSFGFDINDLGVVVGALQNWEPNYFRGFIWDAQHGMRELTPLVDPCSAGPASVWNARRINNRGQILGYYSGDVMLDPYIPGDLDDDRDVDLQDLASLLGNFGRTGDAGYAAGDLDCDDDVDLQDLATLLNNFGQSLP